MFGIIFGQIVVEIRGRVLLLFAFCDLKMSIADFFDMVELVV